MRQLQKEHAEESSAGLIMALMAFFVVVMLATGLYAVRLAQ